ncbi:MAG: hypothetical protein JWO30_4208 [Fibrobacteres bacterium]|nr:hypothetical protein [Fibrobacterota bacterium]
MDGQRKSIHLFDLDDTLIRTEARVLVRDAQGGLLRALAPSEFTVYQAAEGEVFDFREFSDLGVLSRGIIVKYTKTIIDTILKHGTHSEFGILTARADKKLHAPFLIRLFRSIFGVRLSNELIFAVSDRRFSGYKDRGGMAGSAPFSSLSVSQRKAMVIAQDLVGRGFNDISFYDDSRENLESFKVMREAFPHVTYKPHFIDPTWKARLGEFWTSGSESKALIKGASSVRIILEHHSAYGADHHPALQILLAGTPIRLDTVPVWLVWEEGRFYLRRSAGEEEGL